jgi:hypothetical protein
VALVGTQLASSPVKAQVATPIDVCVFHGALIPHVPLESSNLGSFNRTFTGFPFINASACSKVMADAPNAGYRLKSALAFPKGDQEERAPPNTCLSGVRTSKEPVAT